MDVILKVLAGAKVGAKVAVKKEEFFIGRSRKCHLCAGSTSVSRKHCAIMRDGAKVTIKDLGSRNGTLVNDEKISGEVELSSGDEVTVGPLRFLLTITHGISDVKRPQVKSVADAVDRAVSKDDSGIADDDITQWLLESETPSKTATETQTISMDDTNAVEAKKAVTVDERDQESVLVEDVAELAGESDLIEAKTSSSKSKAKKGPGKLPPIPTEPTSKDSQDAATTALRNWNRRH